MADLRETAINPQTDFMQTMPNSYVTNQVMPTNTSTTSLAPEEEQRFQSWIKSTEWFKEFNKEYNEQPNLNSPEYDYRAAWKAGIEPERDPYDKNRFHWPSSLPTGEMLKSSTHPTAWKEQFMRQTGQNPDAIGITSLQEAEVYLQSIPLQQQESQTLPSTQFNYTKYKTWNPDAAQQAKMLESMGTDPMSILEKTGTWKGSDGKWRQEIIP